MDGPTALAYIMRRYPQIPAVQGLTTGTDPKWEGALLRAVDEIEALEPAMWQGWKTNVTSPLQWPRVAVTDRRRNAWGYSPVYGFGFFFDPNSMPDLLQNAQAEEALLLFLLDSDPGYVPALLDEQKGVLECACNNRACSISRTPATAASCTARAPGNCCCNSAAIAPLAS